MNACFWWEFLQNPIREINMTQSSALNGKSNSSIQKKVQTKRSIGVVRLTFIGMTSIIGSGWLFGAFHSAKIAGPASLLAWIIGAAALLLIALTLAELGPAFPQSGGIARYLDYTHGSLSGFLGAWVNWLGIVAAIPTEAAASVQYLSSIRGFDYLFNADTGGMSTPGLVVAVLLMLGYFALNYWTLNLFLRAMTLTTIFKIIVPILSVATIAWAGFQPDNLGHDFQTFAPYGMNAVFIAISAGGIIFAFNGFQSVVNFAGEAKNPNKTIPIALVSCILICLIIYLVLQVGFLGCVSPDALKRYGWHGLNFSSPFVQLALSFNLNLIALLLYIDAVVSPSGTGIAYTGATARMLFGMQRSGYMPNMFGQLHPKYTIPRNAMWLNLILGFTFLIIFRGWGHLANIISITHTLSYLSGPIAAMGLRRIAPDWKKPCSISGMQIIAPLSFVITSLILYWSRWPLTGQVLFVAFGGFFIYLYYQQKSGWQNIGKHIKSGLWFVTYLFIMAFLSWIGDKAFGGINIIQAPYDQFLVAVISLIFYHWGIKSAWATPLLQQFRQNQDML